MVAGFNSVNHPKMIKKNGSVKLFYQYLDGNIGHGGVVVSRNGVVQDPRNVSCRVPDILRLTSAESKLQSPKNLVISSE